MDRPGVHFGLVALLLLAACTATSAQAPSTKTLVVAIPADPQHFNPAHYDWLAYACRGRLALQRLVALDRSAGLRPDLARSWTIEDSGTVYRFRLAKGDSR
jgi:ABC-type transport system substrate-binding protein